MMHTYSILKAREKSKINILSALSCDMPKWSQITREERILNFYDKSCASGITTK
jgi:hypothetical protein